jgi:hypothetical protein
MRPPIHRILLILCFGTALPTTVRAEDDAQALARLKAEITQVVGDGRCGNVSFCRILPMGYDACGNPSAWIAYNNAPDIKEILETKASEVTFVEEDRMRGKPKPADCKPVRAPKLACINGRCVVGDLSY